jgi:two-component system OmpR family response regulator
MTETQHEHTPGLLQFDGLTIDLERYRITRADGSSVLLTAQEQLLLRTLIVADGRVVTRQELARLAWGWPCGYSDSAIWGCVHDLRRKLGDDGKQQRYIKTIRNAGFCIDLPTPTDASPQVVRMDATPEAPARRQ